VTVWCTGVARKRVLVSLLTPVLATATAGAAARSLWRGCGLVPAPADSTITMFVATGAGRRRSNGGR